MEKITLVRAIHIAPEIDINNAITTPEEAYLFSRIPESGTTKHELITLAEAVFSSKNIENIIENMITKNILEEIIRLSRPLRNYNTITFDALDLQEKVALSTDLKKEILFLNYYGKSLSPYKLFNLKKGRDSDQHEIDTSISLWKSIFSFHNFIGIHLGTYEKRIKKCVEIIKEASKILEDPTTRNSHHEKTREQEQYDEMITNLRKKKYDKKQPEDATQHYTMALHYITKEDYTSALEEILMAEHFDPANPEYEQMKHRLKKMMREQKLKSLFDFLENRFSALNDEQKLEKLIDEILLLENNSPSVYMQIAEIFLQKHYPAKARNLIHKAPKYNKELQKRADEILQQAEAMIEQDRDLLQKEKQNKLRKFAKKGWQ